MNQKTQLLKNTVIIAIGKLGTQILSFLLLPLYTAQLSQQEFGTYDFLVTLSVFLGPIITLLIEESMFRFLIDAESVKDKKQIITATIIYILFGTVSFTIIASIITAITHYEFGILFIFFIISDLMVILSNCMARGMGKIKIYSIANFVLGVFTILLNILFILVFKMQATGLLLANTIANSITSSIVLYILKVHTYVSKENFSRFKLKQMLKYSFPLVPNNLSWAIISMSDRLMLTGLVGADANGVYSIANRFPNIISTCYSFFSLAWKESAAKILKEENKTQYYNSIYRDMKYFLKAITIGLIAVMPFAFKILINSNYNDAYAYIPILTIGIYYANMSIFYGGIFGAYKNTKIMGVTTVIGAIINIGINLVFMKIFPQSGILIATISTVTSTLTVYIYRRIKLRKYIKLKEKFNLVYWILLAITLMSYYIGNKILCAIVLLVVLAYCYLTNRNFIFGIINGAKAKFIKK